MRKQEFFVATKAFLEKCVGRKIQGSEEPLEKVTVGVKSQEETKGVPLEEKVVSSAEAMPPSKEIAEIKLKIRQKPKSKRRPQPQVSESPKKWQEKWVDIEGEKVLFVPSGFEIMTKGGWRPVMMKSDKI